MVPLSVLDQSPIVSGATPGDAIVATIGLARRADALGYRRYWLAEHHAIASLADPAPEVLLARLTAETAQIRLGTGGVMLPHYSAFKVAEAFRVLEALAPGRIDLGLGRAPGGTRMVAAALGSNDPGEFPFQVRDLIGYLDRIPVEGNPFAGLTAMPAGDSSPEVWMLGSSEYGALLAAELGLPYSYAHFIGGDYPEITQAYRERFQPSPRAAQPHVMLTLAALVAPTDEEAETLALPALLSRLRRLRGISGPLPTVAEALAYPWTPQERSEVARTRRIVTGTPEHVRARLEELAGLYGADEVMVVTLAPDYALRERSYALLAAAS
jgi:luciferase family oxidoreductase group 1